VFNAAPAADERCFWFIPAAAHRSALFTGFYVEKGAVIWPD